MSQIVFTMPEPKHRSTKKHVQPASSIPTSEFSHEAKAGQPQQKAAAQPESPSKNKAVSKNSRINIVSVWPLAVGLFLSGFAPEWHTMATQAGVWATRFTFPYSLLAMHLGIGMSGRLAAMPESVLYAQIPIDGLLMTIALACGRSLKSTIASLLLLHGVCTLLLWLLTSAK